MTSMPTPRSRAYLRGARFAVLPAVLLAAVAAHARHKKPPPPSGVPVQVQHLAEQLWGVPLDESQPLTSQIEKLVLDHMNQWLAANPPNADSAAKRGTMPYDVRVRRELDSLFAGLRGPLYASTDTFEAPFGQGRLLGAGYTLGWSDFDRVNVLALYQVEATAVQPVAVTRFVPDVDLHYHFLEAPAAAAGQFWFMLYGTRLGKSHPRLSAELYSFDGKSLKSLWKIEDAYDGSITFPADRVVLSYLKEDEITQAIASNGRVIRHEAAYRVGPGGLDLDYDH